MSDNEIDIQTADGLCPTEVLRPHDAGTYPGAILLMDAPGVRPALTAMGQRLADAGYVVLVPDLFYRDGGSRGQDISKLFADDAARHATMTKISHATDTTAIEHDIRAFIKFLRARNDVSNGPIGLTGYCMGCRIALTAAGLFPDDIGAAGGFHGGHLIGDSPTSPARLAPRVKAKVFVGGADNDQGFTPQDRERLEAAYEEAGVDARVEIFEGARHGYTMPDLSVYDEEAAERHWRELLHLFKRGLRRS